MAEPSRRNSGLEQTGKSASGRNALSRRSISRLVPTGTKQRTTPYRSRHSHAHVSADAITDQRIGNTYFSATIEVTADELAKVRQVKLYPGMPVEAAIITGKRTMPAFLLQLFTDSFAHAFQEE
jgi:multidrug efflux pump subunit AcrA (membrane-fusion protein)